MQGAYIKMLGVVWILFLEIFDIKSEILNFFLPGIGQVDWIILDGNSEKLLLQTYEGK